MADAPAGTEDDDLERTPDHRALLAIVVIVLVVALAVGVGWR